jgi:4'-phosphopantetheinyl transferase
MTVLGPQRARFERDEVHLWWRRVDDPGSDRDLDPSWLGADERERCARFRRDGDARAFATRRLFLRSVLAGYLGCAPARLDFRSGEHGKPVLAWPEVDLAFNLSRSDEWMLLGISWGRAVGVDVERVGGRLSDPDELVRVAERVLTTLEREQLRQLCDAERQPAFFRAWARKEAVLKALGTGLTRDPTTVEVGLDPLGPLQPYDLDPEVFPGTRGARLLDVLAPEGFAASLVAEGHDWDLLTCSAIR